MEEQFDFKGVGLGLLFFLVFVNRKREMHSKFHFFRGKKQKWQLSSIEQF